MIQSMLYFEMMNNGFVKIKEFCDLENVYITDFLRVSKILSNLLSKKGNCVLQMKLSIVDVFKHEMKGLFFFFVSFGFLLLCCKQVCVNRLQFKFINNQFIIVNNT